MYAHEPNCTNPDDPLFKAKGYHRSVKNSNVIPRWYPLREESYVQRTATKIVRL